MFQDCVRFQYAPARQNNARRVGSFFRISGGIFHDAGFIRCTFRRRRVSLVRLLSTPLRWFWKLCINTLCGAVLLGLVNLLAPLTGLYIAVTAPAACIVGFFGLPGFAAVVLMQLFL